MLLRLPRRSTSRGGPPPSSTGESLSVSTIERRLSGLAWHYQQRGFTLDRRDRHISTVLAGIRRKHAKPPAQKEALMAEDILEMISILSYGLRDLRDRAILLIGYAGGLRRSEIVGLDVGKNESPDDDSGGFVEILEDGVILFIKGKTGWREVEIGRGSSNQTCPVHALEQWLHFAKIAKGPIFRPVTRDNAKVTADRLSDKHVARLIKKTAMEVGLRPDLPDAEREKLITNGLQKLPNLIQQALLHEPEIQQIAESFADKHHALFLGRGTMYPIAMEGALKLKEISYIHAEAYPAGELKHGPLALIDENMPVIAIAPLDDLLEKLNGD